MCKLRIYKDYKFVMYYTKHKVQVYKVVYIYIMFTLLYNYNYDFY